MENQSTMNGRDPIPFRLTTITKKLCSMVCLCIVMSSSFDSLAQKICVRGSTYTVTTREGVWSASSNWTDGTPSASMVAYVRHAMTIDRDIYVKGGKYALSAGISDRPGGAAFGLTVEKQGAEEGMFEVSANAVFEGRCKVQQGGKLIVKSGATLEVGPSEFSNNSSVLVEKGATLMINGDLINDNNSNDIVVNGNVIVKGNFTGKNGSSIHGSGKLTATGSIGFKNHASAFGCNMGCKGGPCSTDQLCGQNDNMIGPSQSVCSGAIPAPLCGNDPGKHSSCIWLYSTTSASEGFVKAPGQNDRACYVPGPVYTTTWFVRQVTTSSYTSLSEPVKITVNNTWNGTASGDWHTVANWCGGVPGVLSEVVIPAGTPFAPVISQGPAQCKDLMVEEGASLSIGAVSMEVKGNMTNRGVLNAAEGSTIIFNGNNGDQLVSGNNTFYNLTMNKTAGNLVFSATSGERQTVRNDLRLNAGNLITNDNLTVDLNSGQIEPHGSGSIIGRLSVQKQLTAAGFHYLSCPLLDVTVSDINDDAGTANNFYLFDESNGGWILSNDLTRSISPPQPGYALRLYSPVMLDYTGFYDHGRTYEYPLSYTYTGDSTSDGWHLMSNPYPATLDWQDTCIFRKTNIEKDIYFYSIEYGTTSNDRYIAPFQSFWVQAKQGGGKVEIDPKGLCPAVFSASARVVSGDGTGETLKTGSSATTEMINIALTGTIVNIHFENAETPVASVSIHSATGNEIYGSDKVDTSSGNLSCDLSAAHPGIYIVQVVTGTSMVSRKIVYSGNR